MLNQFKYIALICLLVSCGQKKQESNTNADETKVSARLLNDDCLASEPVQYHSISVSQAVNYMVDFLSETNLYNMAHDYAIGGYIDAAKLQSVLNNPVPVYKFYPCFKETALNDKVFMAIKPDENFDTLNPNCNLNNNETLKISSDEFTYSSTTVNYNEVLDFLTNMDENTNSSNQTASGQEVLNYSAGFIQKYTINNQPVNSVICNSFHKDAVHCLLNQLDSLGNPCIGIRYFFGYDANSPVNKIRILLIAVDENKRNLLYNDTGEALILERSYP